MGDEGRPERRRIESQKLIVQSILEQRFLKYHCNGALGCLLLTQTTLDWKAGVNNPLSWFATYLDLPQTSDSSVYAIDVTGWFPDNIFNSV